MLLGVGWVVRETLFDKPFELHKVTRGGWQISERRAWHAEALRLEDPDTLGNGKKTSWQGGVSWRVEMCNALKKVVARDH